MKKLIPVISMVACLAAAGCSDDGGYYYDREDVDLSQYDSMALDFSTHSLAMKKADSCEDYRAYLLDTLAKRIADRRFRYAGGVNPWYGMPEMNEMLPNDSNAADSESSAGEFTTTNTQEAGVDELDTVKNDGKYMYSIRNNEIHITQIWPPEEMKEVATIKRASNSNASYYYSAGIFLADDKLIDVGYAYSYSAPSENMAFGKYEDMTRVRVYDVSDPSKPKLVKTHEIEGWLEDARLINGRLHVVSSAEPINSWYEVYSLSESDIPGVPKFDMGFTFDWEKYDWESSKYQNALKKYKEAENAWLAKSQQNIDTYLPIIRAWVEKKYPTIDSFNWPQYSNGKDARNAFSCNDLYIPGTSSNKDGFLVVSEFSGEDFGNFKAQAVADYGWLIYASTDNLYIISNSSNWWWNCADGDDTCSKRAAYIHHFNLGDDEGQVKYVNSGEISGYVTDSFWLSEYDQHLRVVSNPEGWGNSSIGHVMSVLDITTPQTMKLTGKVDGFGKAESIYAARMIKDKGYVVTFRNTDPLFTFDLSDPSNPKLAGELKINGYSSYIHPVGDTHLLTVGKNADDNGVVNGMQLELFDVTDLAHPKLAFKTQITNEGYGSNGDSYYSSYSWSEALYNHHAFNYHAGSGLLALPVNVDSWSYTSGDYDSWNYKSFSGMFVYRVTPQEGFKFLGGVNHYDLIPPTDSYRWWTSVDRARFYFQDAGVYDQNAYLYTISNHGIKVSDANHPDDTIKSMKY